MKIKTRFYFENDTIKFIKNIIEHDGEISEELLEIDCELDADDSLFEIPEEYAEL